MNTRMITATPALLALTLLGAASAQAATTQNFTAQNRTVQPRTVQPRTVQTRTVQTRTVQSQGAQVGSSRVELGLTGGYAGCLSGEVSVGAPRLNGPLGVRATVSFTKPGEPINRSASLPLLGSYGALLDSGMYTASGSQIVLGVDGTYSLGQLAPGLDASAYAGGRYGKFSSTFGVNDPDAAQRQETTYSSDAFGVGGGLLLAYPVASNVSVVGDLGVDQFFSSSIKVTDSVTGSSDTYRQGDTGYADASAVFNRPSTVLKARVGVKFGF